MLRIFIVFCVILLPPSLLFSQEKDLRQVELSYLKLILPTALLPFSHIEIPGLENIRGDHDRDGAYLALRNFYKQKLKSNGVRAEVAVDFPYNKGDVVTYSWKFMIAKDFKSDAPQNRWWVLADWHDQPDRTKGENWDNFPARSAPIILGYGQINGQDFLSFGYGSPTFKNIGLMPFSRGVWNRVKVKIAWSRGKEGSAEVFMNDPSRPTLRAQGPNMHNDFQHYLKIGSYRHPDIRSDIWVNIADINIVKESAFK